MNLVETIFYSNNGKKINMDIIRKYYSKKLICCSFRGSGKSWKYCYYTLACYFGWRWLFISYKKKMLMVDDFYLRSMYGH